MLAAALFAADRMLSHNYGLFLYPRNCACVVLAVVLS